ncbi:MAG: amino acid adenylation domain-containing protein, partial [Acidobacteriota bacterium]
MSALARALADVMARHEPLRTIYRSWPLRDDAAAVADASTDLGDLEDLDDLSDLDALDDLADLSDLDALPDLDAPVDPAAPAPLDVARPTAMPAADTGRDLAAEAIGDAAVDLGSLRARVLPPPPARLPVIDLRALDDAARAAVAAQLRRRAATRSFDLATGPIVRAWLLRLAVDRHHLLLTVHHIAADGWSLGILLRELGGRYAAHRGGADAAAQLPALPAQYAEHALAQRRWLAGPTLDRMLGFWRARLDGVPTLALRPDRLQAAVDDDRALRAAITLDPARSAAVRAFARSHDATPFMVLLAAFQLLISRWTGQRNFAVGAPIAGRDRPEIEPLVGLFVNTLALRVNLRDAPSFTALVTRTRDEVFEAFAHDGVPFEKLVAELAPPRELGRQPFAQAMFALQNVPALPSGLPGLQAERLDGDAEIAAKFDFALALVDRPGDDGGFDGALTMAAARFAPETVEQVARTFDQLLGAALDAPDRPITTLPALDDDARAAALDAWNATGVALDLETPVHAQVLAQTAARPGAPALEWDGETVDYATLARRARAWAAQLRRRGVRPGDRVALHLAVGPTLIEAMLGVLIAGAAYVPIDRKHPRARQALMLGDVGSALLITDDADADDALRTALEAQGETMPAVVHLPADAPADDTDDDPPTIDLGGGALAYVLYTSGSTGRPKGVGVPHRAILNLVLQDGVMPVGPGDRVGQMANVSFDAATLEIWGALLRGATLVGVSREAALDPARFGGVLRDLRISALLITTALFHRVAAAAPDAFASVEHVLFAGEALDPPAARAVLRATPPTRLLHCYGPTETTTLSTFLRLEGADAVAIDAPTVPIGRPIGNTRAYVVDRTLRPSAIAAVGQLMIAGAGLAWGYHERPSATAARFVPDPFGDLHGDRLYATGDLVRWRPAGVIDFVGRADAQIKLRGFRIEPGEVESILRTLPGVDAAVVLLRRDRGAGDPRLVAYVTADPAAIEPPTPPALRSTLRGQMPEYMVPSDVVVLDALPLNAVGKVDRARLPMPAVDAARDAAADAFIEPRTPIERDVAALFEQLLGRTPIGLYDDFFEAGGHSLLATQLLAQLRQTFEIDLALRTLFERPTPAALAEMVVAQSTVDRPAPTAQWTIARQPRRDDAPTD